MAPAVARAVAQAKAARAAASQPTQKVSHLKALPKQAGGLAAMLLANAAAVRQALADGEPLALPEVSLPQISLPEINVDAAVPSGLGDLFADNPILVGGGAFLLVLPVAINAIFKAGTGGGVKATSVERTYQALTEDERVVLVDVRSKAEVKEQGTPDLRSVKRKLLSLPYTQVVKGEVFVDEDFADKFARLGGISEESLVILLDVDGGAAAKAAAAAISEAVEKVYYVQGGAEEWAETAPWRQPSKGLSLSLPDLREVGKSIDSLAEDFKAAPSLTKAGLAAGAIAGAGFLLVNEIEVVLELAGLWAAGTFALKLLFADERNKTFTEIKTLVGDKVAIQEVGSDLNRIAKAVLEDSPEDAAKPAKQAAAAAAPAASSPEEVPPNVAEAKEWISNWKANSA